jgi:hypothetical protein
MMLKKRTLILIGVAVLATGVLSAQAPNVPIAQATNVPTAQETKWYVKSDWWLVIIAAFTGSVICWQSWQTRKAAEATRDSVKIQEVEFRQWVQVEDWEIDTSPPKYYSNILNPGAAQPKSVSLNITFAVTNQTPRPLTILLIETELQLMSWPSWRCFIVDEKRKLPPQGKFGVMISLNLSGDEVDRFWANDHFVSVIVNVTYDNALGQKSDWSFPFLSKFGRNGSFILTAYNQAKEITNATHAACAKIRTSPETTPD